MPGPNSAPNGDRNLVSGFTWSEKEKRLVRTREFLRKKGQLRTGKTARK